jgi:hypothetical protein
MFDVMREGASGTNDGQGADCITLRTCVIQLQLVIVLQAFLDV